MFLGSIISVLAVDGAASNTQNSFIEKCKILYHRIVKYQEILEAYQRAITTKINQSLN